MTQRDSLYNFVNQQNVINASPERFKFFARELSLELDYLRQKGFDMREVMPDLMMLIEATGLAEKPKLQIEGVKNGNACE